MRKGLNVVISVVYQLYIHMKTAETILRNSGGY